ncbi:MAG: DUF6507 family protein [Propionibacteriaceae bacterium]|nr:DUF6507 family protein [Propionibacteriaceae bacterium]
MTSWSIDPAGLEGLLSSVEIEHTGLNGALEEDFEGIFTGLEAGGDMRGDVATALSGLFEDNKQVLQTICSSVAAGANGVAFAARSCAEGNETMAATVQSEMVRAADTGDFSYFEGLAQQEGAGS